MTTTTFEWTPEQERIAERVREATTLPGAAVVRVCTRRRCGASTVVRALIDELGVVSMMHSQYTDVLLLPSNGTIVIVGTPTAADMMYPVWDDSERRDPHEEVRERQLLSRELGGNMHARV